jgi:sugar transferase (PEP-CTERM system associated)
MQMTTGAVMFVLDAALALLVWPFAVALALHESGREGTGGWLPGIGAGLLYPAATIMFFYALGLYRRDAILETRKALGRIPLVVALGGLTAGALGRLLPEVLPFWPKPTNEALLFTAAVGGFLCTGVLARLVFLALRRNRMLRPHFLVIGAGTRAWDLAWMLRNEGRSLSYEITFLHRPAYGEVDPRLGEDGNFRVIAPVGSILDEARRIGASEIVVAPDERRGMELEELLDCKTAGFPVEQYLSFIEREIRRVDLKRMELSWVLYSEGFRFSVLDRALKRVLDVLASLVILALSSPFLLAAMAAVALDDGFPVLYRQTRVTQGGRHFEIMKLRTMRRDAEAAGAVWAMARDPRITRVGHFLRQTRLDELPQLFNVLRGDMSIVGPRPERPQFVAQLVEALPLYNQRHMLKAGITGWAQVNYPYGASIDDARSKLSYDLYYVKNFSVLFDLLVLLQTIRVVLWPSGVR